MRGTQTILFIIPCLFIAAAAQATPATIATAPEDAEPPGDRRTEVNLGMLLGGSDIGGRRYSTIGVQLDAGRRFGDLVLLGEYSYRAVGEQDNPGRGALNRLGVTARYSLLRTRGTPDKRGHRGPVSGDYWFEAGAGVQRVTWDLGGELTRPDLVLGFGWQLNAVIGRKSPEPRYYGPYVSFRANVSRAPEASVDVPATCGGPCDQATQPSRNDVSLFFHFGFNWAR